MLQQNYDAKPPLLHHNPAIPLSSGQLTILSNFQRQTVLPLTTRLFRTQTNQQSRMVTSSIRDAKYQYQSENRKQYKSLQQYYQFPSRASVRSGRIARRRSQPL